MSGREYGAGRDARVVLRVASDERDAWKRAAALSGTSQSQWIRSILSDAAQFHSAPECVRGRELHDWRFAGELADDQGDLTLVVKGPITVSQMRCIRCGWYWQTILFPTHRLERYTRTDDYFVSPGLTPLQAWEMIVGGDDPPEHDTDVRKYVSDVLDQNRRMHCPYTIDDFAAALHKLVGHMEGNGTK